MSYQRVIPRDLFNEANLLKCLGRLSLLILDDKAPAGITMTSPGPDCGFDVEMDSSDGSISVGSVRLCTPARDVKRHYLRRNLNARDPWPLYVVDDETDEEITVFDDDGNLADEFVAWATA